MPNRDILTFLVADPDAGTKPSNRDCPGLNGTYGMPNSVACFFIHCMCDQARNQGRRRGDEAPPRKFFAPLEKCFGQSSNLLDIVQKI